MDKVLIDIGVVNGIINAYNRAKNQTRIFGIILGTKKGSTYHISDIIYGFIFEDGEDKDTHLKEYSRLNDENLNLVLNSYCQKFNLFSYQKTNDKIPAEKEKVFRSNDSLMILGGFCTDKELFSDLHKLYSTIDQLNINNFTIQNSLLLLLDPNHKNDKVLEYGIKTYLWEYKSIKMKNVVKNLLTFKEIGNEVVQNLNAVNLINTIFAQQKDPEITLLNTEIDKKEKKTTTELLCSTDETSKETDDSNQCGKKNLNHVKNKIKQTLEYLDVIEKMLEENINKETKGADANKEAVIMDKISKLLSELEPIAQDKEIIKIISQDARKIDSVDSLVQLLQTQLNLSEKIHHLIS